MPERRTTVTVDLQLGDFDVADGDVTIPVTLEPEGGAGAGAGAGPGGGRAWQDAFQRTFGTRTTARIIAFFRNLGPLILAAAKAFALLAVVIGAVLAKFLVLYVQAKAAMFILRQLGKAALWAMRQLWEGAKKAASAFVNLAKYAIQKSVEALKRFTEEVVNLGKAVTQHIGGFLKTATGMFADFEQSVANTVTVMGKFGAAGMAMRKQVGGAMKGLTVASRFMAAEAAMAAYEIASAGFSRLDQVVNMTRGSISLAEATLSDLTMTARTMVATMNQFNLAAKESGRVANVFAAAISKSPATMDKLTAALEYAGPIAHSFGIGLEETVAALMGFFKQGRTGSRAGTEFRIMLASLAKGTDKARKVLQGLGLDIDALSPTRVGVIELVKSFEKLRDTVGQAATVEAIYKAFPVRAASAMVAMLGVGSKEIARMRDEITGTNIAAKMQRDQLLTLAGAWKMLVSIWENVYHDVLEGGLSPALQSALKWLRVFVAESRATAIWKEFGAVLGSAVGVIHRLAAVIGPKLLPVLEKMVSQLPEALERIGGAVTKLIPTVISAIEQLPHVLGQVIGYILPMLVKFATTAGPLLLKFAVTVIPLLIQMFTNFGGILTSFLAKNGDQVVKWFGFLLETGLKVLASLPSVIPLFERLIGVFMTWGPYLVEVALSLLPQFLSIIERLLPTLSQLAATVLPMVVTGIQQIAEIIKQQGIGAFEQLIGLVLKVAETAMQALPFVVSIVKKAMWVIGLLLKIAGKDWHKFGTGIVGILKWLDENFYVIIGHIIDIVSGFMDTLYRLLNLGQALSPVLQLVVGPLVVLLGIFTALQAVALGLSAALYYIVKGLATLGGIISGESAADAWKRNTEAMKGWGEQLKTSGADIADTWDAIKTAVAIPGAAGKGFKAARDAVGDFKDILDQTNATIDANIEGQREMEQAARAKPPAPPPTDQWPIPPDWKPPPEWKQTPAGARYRDLGEGKAELDPSSLTPEARRLLENARQGRGTTNVNFNGPDWDEVNRQWSAFYEKQKRAETDAYRTRGAGYAPA